MSPMVTSRRRGGVSSLRCRAMPHVARTASTRRRSNELADDDTPVSVPHGACVEAVHARTWQHTGRQDAAAAPRLATSKAAALSCTMHAAHKRVHGCNTKTSQVQHARDADTKTSTSSQLNLNTPTYRHAAPSCRDRADAAQRPRRCDADAVQLRTHSSASCNSRS